MSQARWFIIHVYSGFEKKVKESIKEQAEQKGLAHLFEEILVPMEEVVEVRRGKKVAAERKFFPGYVMVRMFLNDETWSLTRTLSPEMKAMVGLGCSTPSWIWFLIRSAS